MNQTKRQTFIAFFAAPITAVVLASGVLAIGFAVYAAMRGYTIGELYFEIFPPRFRGAEATELPRAATVAFFVYVIATAELALILRRRFTRR